MQKISYWLCLRPPVCRGFTKLMMIMRLTAFLLTVTLMHAFASGSAQSVTLSGKDLTIRQIFSAVKQQTGFVALYDEAFFSNGGATISVDAADLPLREFLDMVFEDLPVKYKIEGKTIFITAKDQPGLPLLYDPPVKIRVVDAAGNPLSGASVINKRTKRSGITDADGVFRMSATAGDVIEISYVGFETQSVNVKDTTAALFVALKNAESQLGEITINGGYYKTTNRTKTGSISRITSEEIERQPVTSPLMALQGRVPGLDITPTSGVAGSAVKVEIRGVNSLRMNSSSETANSPLFVVDGIPIDATPLRTAGQTEATVWGGYDPLSSIPPSDIESIDVLKDADATAIYGSRGANGVILITTKKNYGKQKAGISANVSTGTARIPHYIDMMNTAQYLTMRKEALRNDQTTPRSNEYDLNGTWDTTRYTNWQKEILGNTATINDVQVQLNGGNNNTSYRVSGSYHRETTIYQGDFGFRNLAANFSLNHLSQDAKFRTTVYVNYGNNQNKVFEHSSLVSQILSLAPNAPALFHEDGSLNWHIVDNGVRSFSTFDNPLAKLRNTMEMKGSNLITNVVVGYKFTPELELSSSMGFNETNGNELIKQPISAISPTDIYDWTSGTAVFSMHQRQAWIVEPQLSYRKAIDRLHIDALLGGTIQGSRNEYRSVIGYGYASDVLLTSLNGATSTYINGDEGSRFKYLSGFFRLTSTYNNRYTVALTGRRDGSSRFGPGKRFGNFGSVGASWIFSREPFMAGSTSFLSFGKLRGSYGITGNDQIGDYRFMNTYSLTNKRYQGATGLMPRTLFNPNFSWESVRKLELALELGLLKDRVSLEAAWYRNRSSNQLLDYQLPSMVGFESVLTNFNATVENRGVEMMLRAMLIASKTLSWDASVNMSTNRNKLVAFPGFETSPYFYTYKIGQPLSVSKAFIFKRIDPQTGFYEFEDVNQNGEFDNNDFTFADPLGRSYYGGITNNLTYGGFQLSFTLQYSMHKLRGYAPFNPPGWRNLNLPVKYLNRWQKPGDIAQFQKFSKSNESMMSSLNFAQSSANIDNASFIRLKTLSFAYNLPASALKKIGLKRSSIYLQGQNLFTITGYDGWDPETGQKMPPLRMIILGLNVTL